MRVYDSSYYAKLLNNIGQNRQQLEHYSDQISSGRKINKASDDPRMYRQKSRLESTLARLEQDRRVMGQSSSYLDSTDQVLGELTSQVRRLRTLVQQRGNGSTGPQLGSELGIEVERLVESGVHLANTEVGGTYLFAGFRSRQPAFSVTRTNGKITAVDYQGDLGYPPLNMPDGESLKLNLNGQSIVAGSGEDMFALAMDIRDQMSAEDFDSDDFLNRLEKVETNLLRRRAEAASAGRHLEKLDQTLADRSSQMQREYDSIVAADLPTSITSMLAAETSLQASLQVAARGSSLSLVNYLR